MLKRINHLGIAVHDLDRSVALFKKILSADSVHIETIENQKVKVASFKIGNGLLELTMPTDESSPIAKFLESKGEGVHHIAFESDNIELDLEELKQQGIRLINEEPLLGAHNMLISFLHPKTTNGVLIELCQPNKDK
jgi:methylmalonyl-CoA epimerase